MRINKITSQPNFQAVNQKYFEWAKKDYSLEKNVSTNWLQMLSFEVFLFRKISRQDAIDTVTAVKKYMNKTTVALEALLENLHNPNP